MFEDRHLTNRARIRWRAVVNTVMKLHVPLCTKIIFCINLASISFSRMTLLWMVGEILAEFRQINLLREWVQFA
jgi:hypothetical protein